MKVNKTWAMLGAATAIGLLAALGANRYIGKRLADIEARGRNAKTIRVVVAKTDLPRGAKLTSDNVAVRAIPVEYAHSGAVLPEQFDRIENQAIAYNVKGGEAILWALMEGQKAATFSSRVAVGRRAMSVPVDDINSISGMLEPGDLIDLMLTIERKGKKVTFPLIQRVSVLAAGRRVGIGGENGERRSYSTITLDTTPEEARRIIIARDAGKITALLRNPQDRQPMTDAMSDASGLFGAELDDVSSSIPVIYGGRRLGDIPQLNSSAVAPAVPAAQATATVMPRASTALAAGADNLNEKPTAPIGTTR